MNIRSIGSEIRGPSVGNWKVNIRSIGSEIRDPSAGNWKVNILSTILRCKDKAIRKLEFVAKTNFLFDTKQ